MKKFVFSKTLALILCFMLAFSAFTVNAFAADEDADIDMGEDVIIETLPDAYVSASGNDSNAGTEAAPFATLEKALKRVSNNGRIHIVGTYTVPAGMNWVDRNVDSVTITGGTLNLATVGNFVIGYNIIFDSLTIAGTANIYANGYDVTFNSNISTSGTVNLYGGSNSGEALESTNLTVLGGTFATVYGGGSAGKIGATNLKIGGGTITTVYGGSNAVNHEGDVNVEITGGNITSVYGGSSASNLNGNVTIDIKGGTIKASIFGGSHNEIKRSGSFLNYSYSWNTYYHVIGNIDLILREGVTLNMNSGDKSIFAHSRGSLQEQEVTNIIFLSESFYNSTTGKLAGHDSASLGNTSISNMMGTDVASSADYVHVHGVTADDTNDIITEGCTLMAPSGATTPCTANTVTLTLDNKASLVYSGEEITPMTAAVNGTLTLGEPVITYSDNVNPGTATATMSYGGASVSKTFTIEKQTQKAPALVAVPESISGLADGEIYGLTTEMEISTDGATYNAVKDTTAKFAAGTYYVRYAETDYKKTSEPKTVVIEAGKKLIVTFIADGNTVATKEVSYGETLTDIPAVPAKVGYDKTAPYWDVTDFSNITSDITANAVYTINTYTVKFVADGVSISEQTVEYGADAEVPEIPAKDGYTMIAPYWDAEANNVTSDLTINAVYIKNFIPGDVNDDNAVNLKDLVAIAQYVAKWENVNVNSYALDINGDGDVTLEDVNTLARYLAGWNETLSSKPYMG